MSLDAISTVAEAAAPLIAGAFGLLFGSFLNVCIYRSQHDLSIARPARSIDTPTATDLRFSGQSNALPAIRIRRGI